MHTRSTYLQIKPGREAILKNTRNNAKLQKDYEGNSLSCAFMLPILWSYLIKIIYYILDTVSGSKDTEKINKLFFFFFYFRKFGFLPYRNCTKGSIQNMLENSNLPSSFCVLHTAFGYLSLQVHTLNPYDWELILSFTAKETEG